MWNMTSTRTNKKLTVVTYGRISNDPLAQEAGVGRQRKDTGSIATANGWEITRRYEDNDRSASRHQRRPREQWDKMIEAAERGDIDVVIAYDLDRMVRMPGELERLIDLADNGLRVYSATGELDLTTAHGRMIARILVSVAAHEADRVSERTKNKNRHDALEGKPHWARRPYGYNMDGTIVTPEAKIVAEMYSKVADGVSPHALCVWLNEQGIKTSRGNYWGTGNLNTFIRNRRNIGQREYEGKIMTNCSWEPIVSEELFNKAVASLDGRKTGHGRKNVGKSMLAMMVRCEHGHTMGTHSSCGESHYRCNYRGPGRPTCSVMASMKHVNDIVAGQVILFLTGAEGAPSPKKRDATTVTADAVIAMRADLAKLAAMLGNGDMDMDEYTAARGPLKSRLAEAERELSNADASFIMDDVIGDVTTLADRWDSDKMTVDQKRRIISSVVERVEIKRRVRSTGRHFDRNRVEIVWRDNLSRATS